MSAFVVVSVGTDFHPFNRLTSYMKSWHASNDNVSIVLQHGSSQSIPGAQNHTMIPRDTLMEYFRTASAVVTQVGPGTILDANSVGRRPIVIPRSASLGEHIDDHQLAFGRMMHELGYVVMVQNEQDLIEALDEAIGTPGVTMISPRESPSQETARRLGVEISATIAMPVKRFPAAKRVWTMLRT